MAKRVIQYSALITICKDEGATRYDSSTGYLVSLMSNESERTYPRIELSSEDNPDTVKEIFELDEVKEILYTDYTLMWEDGSSRGMRTLKFPLRTSCKKFLEALDDHRPDIFFRKGTDEGWPNVRNLVPESIAHPAFPADCINAEGQEIETSGQFKKEILDFLGQNESILSRAVLSDESFWRDFIDTIPQLRIRSVAIVRSIFFNNILPVVWRRNVKRSLKNGALIQNEDHFGEWIDKRMGKNERDDVVMGNGVKTEIPQIVFLSSDPETQRVELAELRRRGESFEE
ncbi:hypothetical protein CAEBREN_03953 [Caenorhabditis brenneri]|uniref:Uncharacterized protein n=1 Tax=Caenorhabditis brenneri TaxID=135651 RepID=G0NEQ6_CAEBE|nr:hypothetical protein CAEBREN_03953 [Caenorhabditis brenneri]